MVGVFVVVSVRVVVISGLSFSGTEGIGVVVETPSEFVVRVVGKVTVGGPPVVFGGGRVTGGTVVVEEVVVVGGSVVVGTGGSVLYGPFVEKGGGSI